MAANKEYGTIRITKEIDEKLRVLREERYPDVSLIVFFTMIAQAGMEKITEPDKVIEEKEAAPLPAEPKSLKPAWVVGKRLEEVQQYIEAHPEGFDEYMAWWRSNHDPEDCARMEKQLKERWW